ncbi:MAG: AMP-binding protein, partial [Gammaproteobacteria bacterium]
MQKIWLESYPEGVPAEIDPGAHCSLIEMFEQACARFAERPAFANMGHVMSFRELDEKSRDFAAYLQNDLALERGERVALMMPNLLQYPVALFGLMRAGLVAVNVNPLYTSHEIEHQVSDARASTIIVAANFAHELSEALEHTEIDSVIVTEIGDMLSFPKSLLVNFVVKYIKRMVPAFSIPGAIKATTFNAALGRGRDLPFKHVDVAAGDIAFLQYTGGTTGVAKGAVLTHRNMISNVLQIGAWLGAEIEDGKEIVITALPLYHVFCLTANCMNYLWHGGLNVLITNPRDLPRFIADMSKWKFTALTGVNTLFNALANDERFAALDFSALKLCVGGGMAVQRATAEKWHGVTGCHILEGYGLTESSPVVCVNPTTLSEYSGAIGLPVPSTEVSLRDDDGNEVATGERGELWVRGPQVMRGYWNRPEETAETLREDGWLLTGDVAVI